MRTHLILPEEMVKEVDALVGKRKRSQFVGEAVREKLRKETLRAAIKATAGIFAEADHPEWATSEKAADWVRKLREESNRNLESSSGG